MEFLTEKCKRVFEIYYIKFARRQKNVGNRYYDDTLLTQFYQLPLLMQWGVYKKFFAREGFFIDIVSYLDYDDNFRFYWCLLNDCYVFDEKNNTEEFKTMESAMEAGIKRANELYNEK